MKNLSYLIIVVFCAIFFSGCASSSGHTKYRGNPNTPLADIQPLRVDPNVLHGMSPQQRIEYLEYVSAYNKYARDVAYTNGYTAYNEKQWVNDAEGGAPSPPADYGQQSQAQSRRSVTRKQPTIQEEVQKKAVYETKRVIDNSMRTTSQEISKEVTNIIRNVFK